MPAKHGSTAYLDLRLCRHVHTGTLENVAFYCGLSSKRKRRFSSLKMEHLKKKTSFQGEDFQKSSVDVPTRRRQRGLTSDRSMLTSHVTFSRCVHGAILTWAGGGGGQNTVAFNVAVGTFDMLTRIHTHD